MSGKFDNFERKIKKNDEKINQLEKANENIVENRKAFCLK